MPVNKSEMLKYMKFLKVKDKDTLIKCISEVMEIDVPDSIVDFVENFFSFLRYLDLKDPKAFECFNQNLRPFFVDVLLFVVDLMDRKTL